MTATAQVEVPRWSDGRTMPLREQAIAAGRKRRLQYAVLWASRHGWFALPRMLRELGLSKHFTETAEWRAWLAEGIFESNSETTRARQYRLARIPCQVVGP